MTTITKTNFVNCLKKCSVIESSKLDHWLDELETDDANEIAAKLVRDEMLTAWQAKYLLSGRHRLDIGSYRLLNRLQRDELGDRFLAVHNQLGRKVDLQILPAELTRDKNQCDKFIEKASQAAKLDHPNLMHVYDIDQEGGRYFLVTEHVQGVSLDEAPRDTISDLVVARIIDRVTAGIQYAHENGVRHGDVTERDILLGEDGVIKVQNIAITPLRIPSKDADKRNDFQSIAVLAHGLLKQIPSADDDATRALFKSVITTMVKGDRTSVQAAKVELSSWLAENDINELGENPEVQGAFDFPTEVNDNLNAPMPPPRKNRGTNKQEADTSDSQKSPPSGKKTGPASSFARRNPIAVLAAGFVIGLLLVAGVGFLAYFLFRDESTSELAKSSGANSSNSTESPNKTEEESPLATLDPLPGGPDPEAMQEFLKKFNEPGSQPGTVSDTTGSTNPPAEIGQNDNVEPPADPPADPPANPPANPPAEVKPVEPVLDDQNENDDPVGPVSNPDPEPPTVTPTPPEDKPEPVKKPEPVEPDAVVPPFTGFPQSVSLPPLSDSTEMKICDHQIPTQFLLAVELSVPMGVAKFPVLFSIDRASDDKQKWIVTAKKREKEKGEDIASFRKSDSAFFFQWLPNAEKSKIAGYLQNCMLKLVLPADNTWLYLRSPVLIDPLILTTDDLSSEIATDVDYLPDPRVLSAEIVRSNLDASLLNPNFIDLITGEPARILLMPADTEPFAYVQVAFDIRGKLKAGANMVSLTAGRPRALKNFKDLEATLQQITQLSAKASSDYQATFNFQPPPGQQTAFEKAQADLKRNAATLEKQANKTNQYLANATNLMNQEIAVRVYAKFNGHEVEIARTKPKK